MAEPAPTHRLRRRVWTDGNPNPATSTLITGTSCRCTAILVTNGAADDVAGWEYVCGSLTTSNGAGIRYRSGNQVREYDVVPL